MGENTARKNVTRLSWEHGTLAILACFLVLIFWSSMAFSPSVASLRGQVVIGGTTFTVDIVQTPSEREQGLSGRQSLPDGSGMLFIFDHPDRWGFWMPNMHFAIDLLWIGADRRIVDIATNVRPDSYPNVFTPATPAVYVLEIPGGSVLRHEWKEGDTVSF